MNIISANRAISSKVVLKRSIAFPVVYEYFLQREITQNVTSVFVLDDLEILQSVSKSMKAYACTTCTYSIAVKYSCYRTCLILLSSFP